METTNAFQHISVRKKSWISQFLLSIAIKSVDSMNVWSVSADETLSNVSEFCEFPSNVWTHVWIPHNTFEHTSRNARAFVEFAIVNMPHVWQMAF